MNIDPIEVQEYLRGVEYPESWQDLAAAARDNGAPDVSAERLRNPDRDEFSGPDKVQTGLWRL